MYTTLKRDVYRVLVEECDWMVLPGKLRCRGDDNIKVDIKGIRRHVADWDNLVQDKEEWCSVLYMKIKLGATRSARILDSHLRHSLDATFPALYILLRTSCCLQKTPISPPRT
jgi:hypothetical protein